MAHIRIDIGRGGRAPKQAEAETPPNPRRESKDKGSQDDPGTKKARPT